ncbi:MAG: tyrosine-type recombinase/integrase [Methanothrix sp.]|nr:tyrosine-type recombinase/integrase [Methanothrix sp.]
MPGLKVNWSRTQFNADVNPALKRFERWLIEHGYREACIQTYVGAIRKFLGVAKSVNPTPEDAMKWHGDLAESKFARSTVNIWGAALKAFYKSRGMELTLPYMKVNNKIPYFFSEEEVLAIFNATTNLKHYTMLSLMFYCMLRAGDLINLEDDDINMKTMTLRIRDGKFGKSAILPIPQACIPILEQYLQIRPRIEIEGKYFVFYTDRQNKWNLRSLEIMFAECKKRAGVKSRGSVHVWGRHSPASIMVKHDCDIYSLQQLMRHSSIKTTARYLHTDVATLREKQNQYLDI